MPHDVEDHGGAVRLRVLGRMRELEKLPVAQARRTWRATLDWMLDARAE